MGRGKFMGSLRLNQLQLDNSAGPMLNSFRNLVLCKLGLTDSSINNSSITTKFDNNLGPLLKSFLKPVLGKLG